jgi:NIMA (never in mitosis gene a)-related kinase
MEDADGEGNKASGHNLLNERTIYGDYEVIKPIGKGKFAVVYRARRISDNETVALKRISVDSVDAKAREKCLKEVKLLQSLDHPNVIKYLDSFITDDDLVIIVEWAAAGDLKRQLRKAQERGIGFEERVIWKYFSQMCQAMQHLREKRIMHRDLKPANIFLTLDGRVKVGDLGLSRELSEHTVQAHSKVGTPLYMSPEVLRGDGYDFKSDIWSLGCLLYELAMLKSPFKSEGLNLYSLFQKISQGDYQPLPENYSEKLRNLAYSMISIKSEDRPEIGDVCRIANEMRQLTNEKQGSSNPKKKDDVSVNGNSPIDRTDAKNIDAKETVSRDNTATVVPVVNDKND